LFVFTKQPKEEKRRKQNIATIAPKAGKSQAKKVAPFTPAQLGRGTRLQRQVTSVLFFPLT
jgi:hypothetical protein